MKQLLLILLAAILSLSLMACSVASNNDDPSKPPTQSTADSDNKTSSDTEIRLAQARLRRALVRKSVASNK